MFRPAFLLSLLATPIAFGQEGSLPKGEPVLSDRTASDVSKPAPDISSPLEPRSLPGVVTTVADSDGNEYPMVVVQSVGIKSVQYSYNLTVMTRESRSRTVAAADGANYEQTYSVLVPVSEERQGIRRRLIELSRRLVPLSASVRYFRVSGGYARQPDVVKPGTDVLVTATTQDAERLVASLSEVMTNHMVLTGLPVRLPEYIIALDGEVASDVSLKQALDQSAPFKGNVKFFGDPKQKEGQPQALSSAASKPRSLDQLLQAATPYRGTTKFFGDLSFQDDGLNGIASKPANPQEVLQEARQHLSANRYGEAERLLTSLINARTREPMAHYLRGYIRYNRSDLVGANQDFKSGAAAEAPRGYSRSICIALEFVQGPGRIALEKHRRALSL